MNGLRRYIGTWQSRIRGQTVQTGGSTSLLQPDGNFRSGQVAGKNGLGLKAHCVTPWTEHAARSDLTPGTIGPFWHGLTWNQPVI